MSDSRAFVWVGVVLSASACTAAKQVNIGDEVQPEALGAELSDYSGVWEGYVEAFSFADGADRVRITLDRQGAGVLVVGAAEPLAAVADPTRVFPGFERLRGDSRLVPGFSYPVYQSEVKERRIRFGVHTTDLYADWCGQQQPHQVRSRMIGELPPRYETTNTYNCVGWWGFEPFDAEPGKCWFPGTDAIFDCDYLQCISLCQCDETACDIVPRQDELRFDAALQSGASELVGTLQIANDAAERRVNVRLTRVER